MGHFEYAPAKTSADYIMQIRALSLILLNCLLYIYRLTFDIKTFIILVEEARGRSSCRNSCDVVILYLKLCYSTAKIKKLSNLPQPSQFLILHWWRNFREHSPAKTESIRTESLEKGSKTQRSY